MTTVELIARQPIEALIAFIFVVFLIRTVWKSFMRHLNIRSQGWPPPHFDADGDFKSEPEKDEEQ